MQFTTFFQFAIADSSVREVEFCTIVIHPKIPPYICKQKGSVYALKQIPSTAWFKIRSEKSTPSESPKLRTKTNPEIFKHKLSVLLCESSQ